MAAGPAREAFRAGLTQEASASFRTLSPTSGEAGLSQRIASNCKVPPGQA